MNSWNVAVANQVLEEQFAAWVRDLGLSVEGVGVRSALLRMPFKASICRPGGVVSGQAISALADTAMVFAIASAAGGFRPMATIDLHTTFMRGVVDADVLADSVVERLGRQLAFVRVAMRAVSVSGSTRVDPNAIVATAIGTFSLS